MSKAENLQGLLPKIDLRHPVSSVDFSDLTPEPVDTPAIFVVGALVQGQHSLGM